jgi:hypothetical protein
LVECPILTIEIYDLENDSKEENDIAITRADIVYKAKQIIKKEHTDSPVGDWNFAIKLKE